MKTDTKTFGFLLSHDGGKTFRAHGSGLNRGDVDEQAKRVLATQSELGKDPSRAEPQERDGRESVEVRLGTAETVWRWVEER